ncbi:MAG: hypothetical protein PVH60_04655 [Anaerolineales bacterium]
MTKDSLTRHAIEDNIQRRYQLVTEDEPSEVIGFESLEEDMDAELFPMFVFSSPKEISSWLGDQIYDYSFRKLNDLNTRVVWVREENRDPIVDFL